MYILGLVGPWWVLNYDRFKTRLLYVEYNNYYVAYITCKLIISNKNQEFKKNLGKS